MAILFIGVVVLRSPDTHGNLWNDIRPGYARTSVAIVEGAAVPQIPPPQAGVAVPEAQVASSTAAEVPVDSGRQVYVALGCPKCHGLDAQGGPVGPALGGADPYIARNVLRNGPGGMPAYTEATLNDQDLVNLTAYLNGAKTQRPDPQELASALRQLSFDPLAPQGVLLEGKTAMRQYCGACHTPPNEFGIRGGFDTNSLMLEMAREPTLSLDEAKAIGLYILAVRNDVQVLKLP
jgi:mono/diheme cytochrome c family protein